jgi:hypothetical protein
MDRLFLHQARMIHFLSEQRKAQAPNASIGTMHLRFY